MQKQEEGERNQKAAAGEEIREGKGGLRKERQTKHHIVIVGQKTAVKKKVFWILEGLLGGQDDPQEQGQKRLILIGTIKGRLRRQLFVNRWRST